MDTLLLGVDIGTTGTNAAVFTPEGKLLAIGNAEYEVSMPHSGWAEQNPEHWWQATCKSIREVLQQIRGVAVDVYPSEPIPEDYPFIQLDNVILSPHLAGSTTDVEKYHTKMIVNDLSLAIQGKKPVNLYNPESWEKSFFNKKKAK